VTGWRRLASPAPLCRLPACLTSIPKGPCTMTAVPRHEPFDAHAHREPATEAGRCAARRRAGLAGVPAAPLQQVPRGAGLAPRRATCDLQQITRWWVGGPYNVGIACQAAGLVVIDLDGARGQQPPPPWDQLGVTHGRDVLRILAQRAGAPDPIDTYSVSTPSGEHRYFLAPPDRELRCTTGPSGTGLGWCIDIRGAGGAIIAAGSVRRVEGRPRLYRVARDIDPVALPRWLVTALTPPPVPARSPIRLPSTGRRLDAYVAAALDGETNAVTHAAPGTRAHTLFRSAACLGELVGAGILAETLAVGTLLTAAAILDNGTNRFPRSEALGHITNGITRGRRNPRQLQDPTP
jgi:hypothetical protein